MEQIDLGEVESSSTTPVMNVGGWAVPLSALRWKTG